MEKYVDEGLHELTEHGNKDFRAAIYRDSYFYCQSRFYYSHYHEEYEIITAVKGEMEIDVAGTPYLLSEHEMVLVNSNVIHCIMHSKYPDSLCYTFLFHPSLLHYQGSSYIEGNVIEPILSRSFEAVKIHNESLYKALEDADCERKAKDKGYPLDYLIAIYKVVSYVYKNYDSLNPSEKGNIGNERIQKALSYIYKNYPKEISVSDIAKIMELSDGEASRFFKKMTGRSITDYIVRYRITMSDYYLKSTDKSITDIAFLCGFSSSNYFTIAFKKINGITPKEFRNQK